MSAHDFDTHRCEGSLRALCSIRRYQDWRGYYRMFRCDGRWHLYQRVTDWDCDSTYMSHVAAIRFCPWCGEEL